jgi:hypothetical protein
LRPSFISCRIRLSRSISIISSGVPPAAVISAISVCSSSVASWVTCGPGTSGTGVGLSIHGRSLEV